jgi:hypothetical protein
VSLPTNINLNLPSPVSLPSLSSMEHLPHVDNSPISPPLTDINPDTIALPIISAPPHGMITKSKHHIHKPKTFHDDTIRYPTPRALTATLGGLVDSDEIEPTSFTATEKSPAWRQAMNEKFDALLKNGTWNLVTPSMNIVGSKWVFKIKRHANGSIERYKARLVAKGFINNREWTLQKLIALL